MLSRVSQMLNYNGVNDWLGAKLALNRLHENPPLLKGSSGASNTTSPNHNTQGMIHDLSAYGLIRVPELRKPNTTYKNIAPPLGSSCKN